MSYNWSGGFVGVVTRDELLIKESNMNVEEFKLSEKARLLLIEMRKGLRCKQECEAAIKAFNEQTQKVVLLVQNSIEKDFDAVKAIIDAEEAEAKKS